MKNYVGKKIRGFRFEDGTDGVGFHSFMNDCIGKLGEITHECECCVTVKFANFSWHYPISLIEPHLIEEEATEIPQLGEGVLMEVSDDGVVWALRKVVGQLQNGKFIDAEGLTWKLARPIQQLPKYTHAELVEKLGEEFEYGGKDE